MARFAKYVLWLVLALIAAGLLLLLTLNFALRSDALRDSLRDGLADLMDADELTISAMSVSPWSGIEMSGIEGINHGENRTMRAETVRIDADLWPLVRRRLLIREIRIENPEVVIRTQPEPQQAAPPLEPFVPVDPVIEPRPQTAEAGPPPEEQRPAVEVKLELLKMNNGTFAVIDPTGAPLLTAHGIEIDSDLEKPEEISGNIAISRVMISGDYQLENLRGPFTYTRRSFSLPALEADAAGGKIAGRFLADHGEPGGPWTFKGDFSELNLARLAEQGGGPAGRLRGSLDGIFDFTGELENPDALRGAGKVELKNGAFDQVEIFKMLGDLLKIEELIELQVEQGTMNYTVENETMHVHDLLLESQNLALAAEGEVRRGQLDLDAQLTLGPKVRKRIPSMFRKNMVMLDDGGAVLEFDVTGTLENPETNLVERFVGDKLEEGVKKVLDVFFGQ